MFRLIYLLRHGQTRFNAEQRLQGRCNSDLTDKGEAQAIAMGRRLADELVDPARWTVYASRSAVLARLRCWCASNWGWRRIVSSGTIA